VLFQISIYFGQQCHGTQKSAFFFPNALFLDTPSFLQAYSSNPASFNPGFPATPNEHAGLAAINPVTIAL